ncbi:MULTISPECIES: cytochrome b [unclassified Paludibacterium]|uniref:cytochrome b n=1 Tax=unclassified Paludibacterium TaxID=2618429 RepID=UPI001C053A98|nr:cytochrome b [Paludibacterium sp. B53371]BEV71950.1 cytochrome b [Paludibacterium sp. THUN1379]
MVRQNYHPASIVLHWLMFLLFAAALLFIEMRDWWPKGTPMRDLLRSSHIDAGLLVLLFAVVRVASRISLGGPAPIGPRLQTAAASALHGLLYLVMFLLPITGVVFSQAGGREVALFGWALPHLVNPDPALRGTVKEVHEFLGNAVYFLVGVHALAALWHHVVLKDETLLRMTFRRR